MNPPSDKKELETEHLDKFLLVHIRDELFPTSVISEFFEQIDGYINKGDKHIVLFFHCDTQVTSSFIGFLYDSLSKIKKTGGSIQIVAESKLVFGMLEMVVIEKFIPLYKSLEAFKQKNIGSAD
jgi:hypothetical protein